MSHTLDAHDAPAGSPSPAVGPGRPAPRRVARPVALRVMLAALLLAALAQAWTAPAMPASTTSPRPWPIGTL